MKKTLVLFLFFTCFFLPNTAKADDIFDLKATPWGMNRKDTAKAVGVRLPPSVSKNDGLTVNGFELAGFDGSMAYVFLDDRLVEVHFKTSDEIDSRLSSKEAVLLKKRLEKQFDRKYGVRMVDNKQCDNVTNCEYSLWFNGPKTAVGIYLTDTVKSRNLAISYMERLERESGSPFWEPEKGFSILPPDSERSDFSNIK